MKKFAAGVADEAWKVTICANDARIASEVLSRLSYILTDAGNRKDLGLDEIRKMSGEDIINGLVAYQKSAIDSVENALKR